MTVTVVPKFVLLQAVKFVPKSCQAAIMSFAISVDIVVWRHKSGKAHMCLCTMSRVVLVSNMPALYSKVA